MNDNANLEKYVSVLEHFSILNPEYQFGDSGVILWMTKASYRKSRLRTVRIFLSENNISQMDWHACSPGSNPMKKI